mgnify:CR=1 FL=1
MRNLSICIITRDESEKLEHCLSVIEDHIHIGDGAELVVVDTGSADDSNTVAKKHNARVYEFEWCDDFAAAKNFCIGQASNDTILLLDTDEYIESFVMDDIEKVFLDAEDSVGLILRENHYVYDGQDRINNEWIPRIFSRRHHRYEGRIHEQLVPIATGGIAVYGLTGEHDSKADDGNVVVHNTGAVRRVRTGIVIDHDGYMLSPEAIEKKADRNIRLLEDELGALREEDAPDDKIAYVIYQLGKSYYFKHDYHNAAKCFDEGLSYDLDERKEYVIDMVVSYGYSLINLGEDSKALLLEGVFDTFSHDADYLFVMGLIYMKNARFSDAIRAYESAIGCKECRTKGVNSFLSYYNMGVIYECLGYNDEARDCYSKCRDYEPAKKNMINVIDKMKQTD